MPVLALLVLGLGLMRIVIGLLAWRMLDPVEGPASDDGPPPPPEPHHMGRRAPAGGLTANRFFTGHAFRGR